MNDAPELAVTLSHDLMAHLRAEAERLDVPLEWLVAAMIVDTIDAAGPLRPAA